MRTRSQGKIRVDLITSTSEVAEVAKFAIKLGYQMDLFADAETTFHAAILERETQGWLADEIAYLVYLEALAQGRSVNAILDETRGKIEALDAPLDVPPMDAPGIGDLHPDGHPDE